MKVLFVIFRQSSGPSTFSDLFSAKPAAHSQRRGAAITAKREEFIKIVDGDNHTIQRSYHHTIWRSYRHTIRRSKQSYYLAVKTIILYDNYTIILSDDQCLSVALTSFPLSIGTWGIYVGVVTDRFVRIWISLTVRFTSVICRNEAKIKIPSSLASKLR